MVMVLWWFFIFMNEYCKLQYQLHICVFLAIQLAQPRHLSPLFRSVSLQLWQVSSVMAVRGGEWGGRSNTLYSAVLCWCICYNPDSIHISYCKGHQAWYMCIVSVTLMQFIPYMNISNIFWTSEYQPKNSTQVYQTLQDTDNWLNTNHCLHH